jgi:nitrogen-specific signal transduction histidine kinase
MIEREKLLGTLLDSLVDPFVFVDTNHVIRFMNTAAMHAHQGGADLVGRSLFDCHTEASKQAILANVVRLESGEDEILLTDSPEERLFMRGVRDGTGCLIGYYERYEPPQGGK